MFEHVLHGLRIAIVKTGGEKFLGKSLVRKIYGKGSYNDQKRRILLFYQNFYH